MTKPVARFRPPLVTVTWHDPRSVHDNYTIADVLQGKGVGLQLNRQTSGHLCYLGPDYLEVYSDFDEADAEVGGGTAILYVLITKIKMAGGKVIYTRG